ncbi:hypothetical protein GCM10009541_29520 [Micromonospora gifhornensis]|uniref:Phosphatidic acid phosphatase type 2/haloperoxidase domain-containing protein n=1 Tax=Micromonospora gifhornensis TaxID=84594 RepID=A0ABQ4I8E0_9ACTN|nr:phosphatase PAP2 family protein [Micromonospora gifhornensis]GIJ14185.1 hypothetical protein Vgi01_08690 [Micromonospora gifhornensis]
MAAGLATAIVLLSRQMVVLAAPLAALAALSRVAVGVHYPYDVLCGVALGVLIITSTVSVTAAPATARLTSRLRQRGR